MSKIVYEPPKLIIIGGPSAVGKTHLALRLMERIAAAYFNRDYTILSLLSHTELYGEDYTRDADFSYEVVFRLSEENLGTGNTVLFDAPFSRIRFGERDRRLEGLVKVYSPDLRLFICTAPDEVIKQRMSARDPGKNLHQRTGDAAKLAGWEKYAAGMHRIGDVKYPYRLIDTTRPAEENVERMLEELSRTA